MTSECRVLTELLINDWIKYNWQCVTKEKNVFSYEPIEAIHIQSLTLSSFPLGHKSKATFSFPIVKAACF